MPRTAEAQREYRRTRYATYKQLCAAKGVAVQWQRWPSHYRELRDQDNEYRRLTRDELYAWWRERFTDTEIFHMGSAMDFLLIEEGGAR